VNEELKDDTVIGLTTCGVDHGELTGVRLAKHGARRMLDPDRRVRDAKGKAMIDRHDFPTPPPSPDHKKLARETAEKMAKECAERMESEESYNFTPAILSALNEACRKQSPREIIEDFLAFALGQGWSLRTILDGLAPIHGSISQDELSALVAAFNDSLRMVPMEKKGEASNGGTT